MPRVARFRTRSQSISGVAQNTMDDSSDGPASPASYNEVSSCSDSHGRPVVDSNFSSTQIKRDLQLNGELISQSKIGGHIYGTRFSTYPTSFSLGSISDTSLPVSNTWFNDVIARTNPSRPVVTIPSLIQDLYELPRMLRDVGRLMNTPKRKLLTAKEIANQHLALQFGWMPFIKDITELLELQSHIDKRHKELARLYSGKGLRRRLTMGKDENSSSSSQLWIRPGVSLKYTVECKLERKQWATIRWKPISPPNYHPSTAHLNRLSRKIVLGFTREGLAKGVWEVLPWSWLINWFINVGSYTLARSNTVPATHSSSCLMNERKLTVRAKTAEPTGGTFSGSYSGAYIKSVKTRTASGSLTAGFNMPYLDMWRLSILSSLTIQRLQR